MVFIKVGLGGSPGNVPTLLKMANSTATVMTNPPNPAKIEVQVKIPKKMTVRSGPRTKASGGPICCTASALPQSCRLTMAVSVAITDGISAPAANPSTNVAPRKAAREAVKCKEIRAIPARKSARTMDHLCFSRDDINPEPKEPTNPPKDANRKIEPAWACVMFSDGRISGINGAKMNRLINVKKNNSVRTRIFQIILLNDSGIGQDLSMFGTKSIIEGLIKRSSLLFQEKV